MDKHVLGISLGDSQRDFEVTVELLGKTVHIQRIGTDGDLKRFVELLEVSDGEVDAIGFGGLDLWLWCNGRKYAWREPRQLLHKVTKTPVFDGSGLKNTIERTTIKYLQEGGIVDFRRSNTLLVCAVDRFGMAEAIWEQGGKVIYGDLMFSLGIPIPIHSLRALRVIASLGLPLVTQLPIKWMYPTGNKQRKIVPKFGTYYAWADVICGDNHYIRRHMPGDLTGKTIITNTTTKEDVDLYRKRGVKLLVTTTPSVGGRSWGTNIFEAAVVAALDKDPATLSIEDYEKALTRICWKPNICHL